MTMRDDQSLPGFSITRSDGIFKVSISGRLDLASASQGWSQVCTGLQSFSPSAIEVDAGGVTYCDGGGLSILLNLKRSAARMNIPFELAGLSEEHSRLLKLYPLSKLGKDSAKPSRNAAVFVGEVGESFVGVLRDIRDEIAFIGELCAATLKTLLRPSSLRGRDLLAFADASGVRALPIIVLLGVLVGLIMAFQGAVLMKQFGAEIYIADFVGLSVCRELGPLITAIIVAGRTGSAFAAELGTMKVNEEIDALTTMGLDPVRFLVIPRVVAATLMTPLLAIFADLAGLAGGAAVMTGLGYPLVTYVNRAAAVVSSIDFTSGLFKALVFGLLVASSGCLCGLRTGEGASAVGNSATRAVVSSIVMIVLADGLFAVLFYYLGI
jgi:phospholipid/cholesterol/gamma-HCH transport system permease protein